MTRCGVVWVVQMGESGWEVQGEVLGGMAPLCGVLLLHPLGAGVRPAQPAKPVGLVAARPSTSPLLPTGCCRAPARATGAFPGTRWSRATPTS